MIKLKFVLRLFLILLYFGAKGQNKSILFFLAQNNTYYSEYIVAFEALKASGYSIDVRSATSNAVYTYMVPSNTTINETANTLPNSNYTDFQTQFQNSFGQAWNSSNNSIPSSISVNGSIAGVSDMTNYDALVIAGGTGIMEYRVDGSYSANGSASAAEVQAAAERLNALAIDALQNGKPVLAQCHGASLPVYWRVPGTSGSGVEILGTSLLKNGFATGYPEAQTAITLADFGITHKAEERVSVSSPSSALTSASNGAYKLITSRDWYPQTVAYATRTLLNILETYPNSSSISQQMKVLVLHGGAVNTNDCLYTNRNNDVPCNYGSTAPNLPADYTDLQTLLSATSSNDAYQFSGTYLNLAGSLPFNSSSETSILNYLQGFHTIIFYKHWSTYITDAMQNALVSFVDQGGGIVGLHHALYNDINSGQSKNIITNQLFGAESAMSTWSASRTTYNLVNTNYGHFVSTYGVSYSTAGTTPSIWGSNSTLTSSNLSYTTYHQMALFDEIYNNMTFVNSQSFGRGTNSINPLFSNDVAQSTQIHTSGFVKLFNPSADATVGRVVFLQPGENKDNYSVTNRYGQIIRNAVVWSSGGNGIITNVSSLNNLDTLVLYPNPAKQVINFSHPLLSLKIFNYLGQTLYDSNQKVDRVDISSFEPGVYYLKSNLGTKSFVVE